MRIKTFLVLASVLLLNACQGKNENLDFDGIVVDVKKEYFQKDCRLQDIADVEYVPFGNK